MLDQQVLAKLPLSISSFIFMISIVVILHLMMFQLTTLKKIVCEIIHNDI